MATSFPSFWMAGFECATQVQIHRGRLDLTAELQHDRYADSDYAMLVPHGLLTVRDGIRWYLVEPRPGHFDFRTVEPLRQAAERHSLTVIWDICHYGWPEDVDPLRGDFADRLARLAGAFARYLADQSPHPPAYIPIVEMSFLSQAIGRWGIFAPFAHGRGYEAKGCLVRAAIAAIEAVREVDPRARIIHAEPLVHFVAPPDQPELLQSALAKNRGQFEILDMLAGDLEPQLGGHPRYLDILGFNYYPYNQQDVTELSLLPSEPRWVHLADLLTDAYQHYRRPFVLSETTGVGAARPAWLEYVASQAERLLAQGLPLEGICLYPITNAPDWDTDECVAYGLWDLERRSNGHLARTLHEPTAAALHAAQARLRPSL
ncbi:MAG: beta-glucosidase [Anaerolineae bacterium]